MFLLFLVFEEVLEFSTPQKYELELEPGYYKFEVWGGAAPNADDIGRPGGYSSGRLFLTNYTKAFVYVGGGGCLDDDKKNGVGGFNGGGSTSYGRSGAGGTDIRLFEDTFYHRIIVGGGSGGGTQSYGGGESGNTTDKKGRGKPGTQTGPGDGCYKGEGCTPGGFGYGGSQTDKHGGGGGGGWYGGASGYLTLEDGENAKWAAAGGGSGFVLDADHVSNVPEEYKLKDDLLYMTNTVILAGNDEGIPDNPNLSKDNNYDGFARITILKLVEHPPCDPVVLTPVRYNKKRTKVVTYSVLYAAIEDAMDD